MIQVPVGLEPQPGQVALRWLGQGGFAFRSPNGFLWLVDPYLSDYGRNRPSERLVPPPIDPATVLCDAVLCTHAHGDHTDPISLRAIATASPDARFYGCAEAVAVMQEAGIPSTRTQTVAVGAGEITLRGMRPGPSDVRVAVVYADHGGDACGFVFAIGDTTRPFRLYVTGDSLASDRLRSEKTVDVDLLCVCINGRMGNMTARDAAMLSGQIGAKTVIPMHYGVMVHNTADPQDFLDELANQEVKSTPRVLEIGESWMLSY